MNDINLIPHSNLQRRNINHLMLLLGLTTLLTLFVALILYLKTETLIAKQSKRNNYLNDHVAELQKNLYHMDHLYQQKILRDEYQSVTALSWDLYQMLLALKIIGLNMPSNMQLNSIRKYNSNLMITGEAKNLEIATQFANKLKTSPFKKIYIANMHDRINQKYFILYAELTHAD